MNPLNFYRRLCLATALGLLAWALPGQAAENKPLKTDSRAPHIHRIPLADEDGQAIVPDPKGDKAKPYSPAGTCGKCHEYQAISHGWHFNAAEGKPAGRPGEPWILADAFTRTQLPLSYRGWKGTWKPADVGLSDWKFVTTFGRQMPGGGVGEPDLSNPATTQPTVGATKPRWHISGQLNVDCMVCHAVDQSYDFNERAYQISYENFRFAPALAAGLGELKGNPTQAKLLPPNWNRKEAEQPDSELKPGPKIKYFEPKFEGGHTLMPVTRTPDSDRCNYCHSVQPDVDRTEYWHSDRDVHIRAGMSCANCHRNGIDHNTVRGYEGEAAERKDPSVASLSCRGCHLGNEQATLPGKLGGRWGAPRPAHRGLPALHLEKLSCTACHSGAWPTDKPQPVQTAMAHALGVTRPNREPGALPRILQTVFLDDANDKITPHRIMWPNFWARIDAGKVVPILPADVKKVAQDILPPARENTADGSKPLADEQITKTLAALAADKKGEYAYISGGKLFKPAADGKLTASDNPAAEPYAWPLAHDVRPAQQALGVRGCSDCHATDSPVYFAAVTPAGPAANVAAKAMHELRGEDGLQPKLFALSFVFRPMLKVISFSCSAVLLAVMALYAFRGMNFVMTKGRSN